MVKVEFNIIGWLALSPGLNNKENWQNWLDKSKLWPDEANQVPADLIPPMMRRRMSRLSKIAVQAALQLSQDQLVDYIIFASRHGELTRTVKLLEDIMNGDDASPLAFSQSVHNTAAGLFTIASKRATPATSLAAGENSLSSALIEAYCYLAENPDHNVLLVDFDEPLPELYHQYETQSFQSYALALLITSGMDYSLTIANKLQQTMPKTPHAFQLIDFLINKKKKLLIQGSNKQWTWIRK
jgi:hypothetical protein